ncbi:cubilin-like [Uloborus diversus]|uniref:cubilin-like n=1 Tax=Uloborus diversus TaxID=327109 RepID=UPI00240A1E09|nr:cubilin-like [Uloborus diversus]
MTINSLQLLTENECSSNPCRNGGTCVDAYGGYICNCPSNWEGVTCETDVNECAVYAGTSLGCQNGATCVNNPGGYRCDCPTNFYGIHCSETHDDCSSGSHTELCGHGTCVNEKRVKPGESKYRCICDAGWTNSARTGMCTKDIDECQEAEIRCSVNPLVVCLNIPGSFLCGPCPPGYTGSGRRCTDINECEYQNGGCSTNPFVQCTNTMGSRTCGPCPPGYMGNGVQCNFVGVCSIARGGCHPLASCIENSGTYRECRCPPGYVGNGEACGGYLTGDNGTLEFPQGQHLYNHGESCAWVITVNETKVIGVQFSRFELESGHNCAKDFLQLHDGPNSASRVIGRFCDSNLHGETFNTTHNQLFLWFRSDKTISRSGFTLNWEAVEPSCGGYLNSSEYGAINSPGYPGMYPKNRNCRWIVQVPIGKRIQFHFATLSLQTHENCSLDYLKIFDGLLTTDPLLGTFCSTTTPPPLLTSGHSATLYFNSDSTIQSTGFHITYSSVPGCGGQIHRSSGVLRSPGYPNHYPHSASCIWLIHAPEGRQITLNVTDFNLELHSDCNFDYLEIRNGAYTTSPLLGKFCGNTIPSTIRSHSNILRLMLKSDRSMSAPGFEIYYDNTATGCGGLLTSPGGSIVSPNYPQAYPSNAVCEWLIRVNHGSVITIAFVDIDIETHPKCRFDYVQIFDGETTNAVSLVRMCNHQSNPGAITSSGNTLLVVFRTDASTSAGGFHLTYQAVCRNEFTQRRGVIESPNFPSNYPRNQNCAWVIRAPKGNNISLAFSHFTLEGGNSCDNDYVEISEVKNMQPVSLSKYCGSLTKPPAPITTSTNVAIVKLVTDHSVTREGFRLEWSMKGCGGDIRDKPEAVILSPNYPHGYPFDVECIWHIWYPPGFRVELTIHELDMEAGNECLYDYFRVYGGEDANAPRLLNVCRRIVQPQTVTSHGNQMTLEFHSDHSMAGKGFAASIKKIPGGEKVVLTVTFLHIGDSENCSETSLIIKDGDLDDSPVISEFCGHHMPPPIVSRGSVMSVFLKNSGIFRATYGIASTHCGGELTGYSGSIASPGFPNFYDFDVECVWTIKASAGSKLLLSFSSFNIEDSEHCNVDYLEVREDDASGTFLGRFCGSNTPPNIPATKTLWVKFRTDDQGTDRGFMAHYEIQHETQLNGTSGEIASPAYPMLIQKQDVYQWTVTVPHEMVVSARFLELSITQIASDMLCGAGVQFFDGANELAGDLGYFCGFRIPEPIISSGNTMTIRYAGSKSYPSRFLLHWTAISPSGVVVSPSGEGCGSRITGTSGLLNSSVIHPLLDSLRRYESFQCEWIITVRQRRTIQVTFDDFNIESDGVCSNNYIMLRNGGSALSPSLGNGKYCGRNRPPTALETSSNELYVQVAFVQGTLRPPVFTLRYTEMSLGCGGRIYLTHDRPYVEISSPNYPSPPSHDLECEWVIVSPSGTRMRMDFENEFHLAPNCQDEYLELFDGGTEMAAVLHRYCGHNQPSSAMTTGSALLVHYVTNAGEPEAGFKGTVRIAQCGGTINSYYDVLTSPNYPENYGSSVECEWFLRMRMGYHIVLNITDLDTPPTTDCHDTDYIEIRDTDAQGCGGMVEGPTGVITSPNYPNALSGSRDCFWRLEAPEGRRIKINFNAFNLPRDESTGTCISYLKHFSDRSRENIPKLCGSTIPDEIDSSSGNLNVALFHNGFNAGEGFSFTYTTDEPAVCGGFLPLPSGNISTPTFQPAGSDSFVDCRWKMVDEENFNGTLVFKFDLLDLPGVMANYCMDGGLYVTGMKRYYLARYCGNYTAPVLMTSPFVSTTLRMVANLSSLVRGVRGTYNVSNCGGILDGTNATISSPGYPDGYPPNTDCHWLINVPEGEEVQLTTVDLRLESDCSKDYVLVRDGYHIASPIVGKFCGTANPIPIVSSSKVLSVIFHSDAYGTAPGFKMSTKELQRGCGGLIHMSQGSISSPGYPSRYVNNIECKWTIEQVPGYLIMLEFVGRFDIENDPTCGKDYVQFVEEISQQEKVECSAQVIQGFMKTTYNVRTELVNLVNTSPLGNSDCVYDYVEISHEVENGSLVHGSYCGTEVPAARVVPGPVTIRFNTDASYTAHGFLLNYKVLDCGGILTAPQGTIKKFPTENEYFDEMKCIWEIRAPPNKVISVRFSSLNISLSYHCWHAYLEIIDGNTTGPSIGKICGSKLPPVIKSSGPNLTLALFSREKRLLQPGIENGSKFAALEMSAFYYTTYGPLQGCGGILNQSFGEISSLDINSDTLYEPNLDCSWTLIGNDSNKIFRIEFLRFDLEDGRENETCISDYVEVRDGLSPDSPFIGRYCGSTIPSPISSSTNKVFISFHTNDEINKAGFKIRFTSVISPCGPSLITTAPNTNEIVSPNYPNGLPPNLRCRWTFVRNMTSSVIWFREMVSLFLIDLDLDCKGDYIEFQRQSSYRMPGWESHTKNNNPPVRICGAAHPHEISGYSGLTLTLHSDAIRSGGRGFKIAYSNAACARVYTRDRGRHHESSVSGVHEQRCPMPSPHSSPRRIYDFRVLPKIVYGGANTSSPLIGSFCGYTLPHPIFSNGTSLYLDFNIKDKIGLYYISYTFTDQGRGCGGRIEGESGALSSPFYPSPWTGECSWQLAVPGYHTIRLKFQHFQLNSSSGCETNYVELYEGTVDDIAKRIVRYCGSDYPGIHNSEGNQVLIKLVTDNTNTAPGFLIFFDSNPYAPDPSMSMIQRFPEERRQERVGDVLYLNP